jgi:D-alanyl-lipoteichoic acid acyltransferase DltB (MBOAT superfamily)
MHKKISLLVIFILLAVQAASLTHLAKHGFEKHKHNGNFCEISFYCSKSIDFIINPEINVIINLTFVILTLITFSSLTRAQSLNCLSQTRAPPVFII